MMLVRACSTPQPERPMPRRLTRVRRMMESKRMDTFRSIHEALKKTANEEQEFVKAFFKDTKSIFVDEEPKEEEDKSE
jgi:hypothetical protein